MLRYSTNGSLDTASAPRIPVPTKRSLLRVLPQMRPAIYTAPLKRAALEALE